MELKELRNEIDLIDDELVQLFNKRMQLSAQVADYKKEHNMTVLQANRYNEILNKRGAQGALCGMDPEFVAHVFENIHEESVRQQIEIINK